MSEKIQKDSYKLLQIERILAFFKTVVGYDAIPEHFKSDLELHDVILHVADDLWQRKITQK